MRVNFVFINIIGNYSLNFSFFCGVSFVSWVAGRQKSYEAFVSLLTDFQFKCLSALARKSGKSVYSMDFVKAVGLHSTASVNRAMTRMIDINILFKSGKEIRFVNPFFKAWLLPRGR